MFKGNQRVILNQKIFDGRIITQVFDRFSEEVNVATGVNLYKVGNL
jgi:hypothetical protein